MEKYFPAVITNEIDAHQLEQPLIWEFLQNYVAQKQIPAYQSTETSCHSKQDTCDFFESEMNQNMAYMGGLNQQIPQQMAIIPQQNDVPLELHGVNPDTLEGYVRKRILEFSMPFAKRLKSNHDQDEVKRVAQEVYYGPSIQAPISTEDKELQLVFRHDCMAASAAAELHRRALGCLDPICQLCEHNPNRRCRVNFDKKYLVQDVLKAKCQAKIRVEVIDRASGKPYEQDIPNVDLYICILDGNQHDVQCTDGSEDNLQKLMSCALLENNKKQPLLLCTSNAQHTPDGQVMIQLQDGKADLPELQVTDSSEALLSGRKPPFRLLVRAERRAGYPPIRIRHAVSEGFVVATRRTRTAGKVEIPRVEDHVSKLEHMGKETVKKLVKLGKAALDANVDLSSLPPDLMEIQKVGQFKDLAHLAEQDGHLRSKLQQVLKLSKEKWEEARDHANRAVYADSRMRAWHSKTKHQGFGLLFTCNLGSIDLERPVGIIQRHEDSNNEVHIEATMSEQQTPQLREMVKQMYPDAVKEWWQPDHGEWAIFPADSEVWQKTGELKQLPSPVDVYNASLIEAGQPPRHQQAYEAQPQDVSQQPLLGVVDNLKVDHGQFGVANGPPAGTSQGFLPQAGQAKPFGSQQPALQQQLFKHGQSPFANNEQQNHIAAHSDEQNMRNSENNITIAPNTDYSLNLNGLFAQDSLPLSNFGLDSITESELNKVLESSKVNLNQQQPQQSQQQQQVAINVSGASMQFTQFSMAQEGLARPEGIISGLLGQQAANQGPQA